MNTLQAHELYLDQLSVKSSVHFKIGESDYKTTSSYAMEIRNDANYDLIINSI